jgi:hypothetical protein
VKVGELPLERQIERMRERFPGLRFGDNWDAPAWRGVVQPTDRSCHYLVEIQYHNPWRPRVRVLYPEIPPPFRHLNPDGSLCLYYPPDSTWSPARYVADIIVPLAVTWLRAYELWIETHVWYLAEVHH